MIRLLKLLLILVLSGVCTDLNAQGVPLQDDVAFSTHADMDQYTKYVIPSVNWLQQTPLGQNPEKRAKLNFFVLHWLERNPDIDISLPEYSLRFHGIDRNFLCLFLEGWIKYTLETKDTTITNCSMAGLKSMLDFYESGKASVIGKIDYLDNLNAIDKAGKLRNLFDTGRTAKNTFLYLKPPHTKRNFRHDENYFGFHYYVINLVNPRAVSYRYMLEGYYNDWIETPDGSVTYPRLPPGNYNFRLQASMYPDFANTVESSYAFNIAKPFWQENWFITLVILAAITGNTSVCLGNTSALTDAGGGTWTSSNTSVARVGLGTGVVTGFGLGTATITYSLGTGCTVTTLVTVNPLPSAITGPTTVCETASVSLSDAMSGGTWSTAATTASVDASGIVTGVSAGTAIISYSLSSGCSAIAIVTVNPSPAAISGSLGICKGSTSSLSDVGGGTWSSSNTSVATIGFATGVTAGLNIGTSSITYTLPSTGCKTAATVTVNPVPAAISGPATVCVGATATLSNAGGGTWTSSNTNTSVDINTGVVTGLNVGTSVITYTLPTGCSTTKTINSNAAPAPIGGNPIICQGATSALSDATPSGTWSSSNTAIAGIGSTGIFTGASAGTAIISYTRSNGCIALLGVVVNPLPAAIIGTSILCTTSLVNLIDATTGGTWTSGNTAVATITLSTGDVSGVTAGTTGITYTLSTGCTATTTLTVVLPPSAISGPANVCVGSPVTFSNAVNGGTWTSSNTAVATAGITSGILSGLSYGTTTLTYQIVSGCFSSTTIRVDTLPASITGASVICSGTTTTLSDASPGGAWSSSNTAVATAGTGTGIVSGVSFGSALITYTLSTGCLTTFGVTVNASPAAIVGLSQVCTGLTLPLTDATTGGTWSSSATSVATVTGGLVAGIAPGTSVIAYTLSSGCASTKTVTVNPLPGPISGPSSVCATTIITLSDATSGGAWVSSKVTVATVGSTGIVSGLAAGTTVITYTLPTSCKATTIVTVNPQPDAGTISGQSFTCNGLPVTLTNTATGGTWTSDNTTIATIDPATGTVTAVSAGIVTISYSVTNVCGTARATFKDTIYAIPSAGSITGADSVCAGSSIILTDLAAGGVWTSDNTAIATVSSTGTVNGVAAGNATISYSVTTPCGNATATLALKVKSLAACKVYVHPTEMVDGYKVYPNPTTGSFIVEIPTTENGAVVTVMDMLGKVIETKSTNGNSKQQVTFNIGQFARGSYMVKVNSGAVTFRQKIELW
jgi:trimeric autotransporter adhesin